MRHELISETAPRIFPKLGMKLGDTKGKKKARPDFWENSYFGQIWPNMQKMPIFGQNRSFWDFAKKRLQQIF